MQAETKRNIRLTAGDISNLWTTYMSDSMAICVLKYFLEKVEDTQIKPIVEYALSLSQTHIETVTKMFESEDIPVPMGFTPDDVNIHAPRLFSDIFILQYLKQMSRVGMVTYGMGLYIAARSDDRKFYQECLDSAAELDNKSTELLLEKGIYIRAPYIPNASQIDFVEKQSFLTGWFGKRRPLTSIEITQIYANIISNSLGKALMMGFSQVATSEEVRAYFVRGRDIAGKHIDIFGTTLRDDHLTAPGVFDSEVTDSTESPFSDKLMLYHSLSLNAMGIGNYGASIGVSPRRDLGANLHRLLAEIELLGEDGANLMIKNGWMEQPPSNVDRDKLAGV